MGEGLLLYNLHMQRVSQKSRAFTPIMTVVDGKHADVLAIVAIMLLQRRYYTDFRLIGAVLTIVHVCSICLDHAFGLFRCLRLRDFHLGDSGHSL